MADKGRYWELEGENATAQAVDNVLSDLTDILTEGPPSEKPENVAVIWVEGDSQGDTPKERRDHFELGEAGGGLETKPTYYTRKEQFDSSVQNVPDGTGRYIEIDTEPNPTEGTWSNPYYPSLKMNDPIYIGTKIKKQTIIIEGEQVEVDVPGQNYLMISDEAKTELRDGSEVKIAGKAKIIIGDTDPKRINNVTSWNPTKPGQSWNDTIYGPTLRFHGTSCIDIDDGYLRKTPTLNIHGGVLVDLCDGSQSNGTYYTNLPRHKDSPSVYPWGTGNGPILHLHDNACLVMDGGCLLNMNSKAHIFASGACDVKFDGNSDVFFSGSADFDMHGGTFLITSGSFKVLSGDFICEGNTVHYGGTGKHDFINNGYIHITNDVNIEDNYCGNYVPATDSSKMFIDIHAAPNIQIGGLTQIQHHGYAAHMMMGRTYFNMESNVNTSDHSKDDSFGPLLVCTPTRFEFVSQGCALSSTGKSVGRRGDGGNQGPAIVYGEYEMKTSMPETRMLLQGNIVTILGSDNSSPLYLNLAQGTFYSSGNCFGQITGTSHIERHDESTLIMRGVAPTEDKDHNPIPSWRDGHVPQASLNKAHLGKTWGRGEIHPSNGPDVEFFDKSRLHMHGYWIDGTIKNGSVEFTTEDTIESISDIQNCQDYIDKLVELNMDITDYTDATYSQQAGTNKYTVTGLEYKLINWSEHPEKNASNPLVEIIEDAEVRCMGDTKFILTDSQRTIDGVTYNEGLTIAVGNDSVNFSIADLIALKNMIPPTV